MALKGTQALLARLRGANDRVKVAAARALDDAGDQVLADSKELCPVSPTNEYFEADGPDGKPLKGKARPKNPLYLGTSGSLRDTGTTEPVVIAATHIFKLVKYTADTAAAVHEVPEARHGEALQRAYPQANIPNLQARWKYLAIPIILREQWVMQHVATAIAGVLDG